MSVVISLRVSRRLKEMLDELGINWRVEVREYLERRVREEAKKRALREARRVRESIRIRGTPAAKLIREDRDER